MLNRRIPAILLVFRGGPSLMRARRILFASLLVTVMAAGLGAQKAAPARGPAAAITPADLKEWLSFIASDQLEGRQVYTEGLGLAAVYIADHLKEWSITPGGDNGTYFQSVRVLGVRTASKASVTVDTNGQTRTFKDGEGITFPKNMGGKQTITGDQIQFVGYGLQIPAAGIDDYARVDPKGKVVVYLGSTGPKTLPAGSNRLLGARARRAVEKGAIAVIGVPGGGRGGRGGAGAPGAAPAPGAPPPAGATPGATGAPAAAQPQTGGRGRGQVDDGDFTTVQHYDRPVVPTLTAQDDFLEFLFSGADVQYAELKDKAAKQEPLPPVALENVKMTINVEADYTVVRTRLTRNVVGIIPGTDPKLKDTYVAFGAHYDHTGYSETPPGAGRGGFGGGGAPGGCVGQTRETVRPGDNVNNGADDDGSGTVAIMGIAKAFAVGPRPKRSLLFVWHSGEEAGLLGSRYNADYPVVPIDTIVATLNLDMVGRNRCDQASEANTVYVVGSDRISSELHNLNEDANTTLSPPMTLDYEMNDPADPESIYTRSDHYSYALKGIPVIFYTTGLHRDYHYLTDEVSKIEFPKMAHIAQLVYTTGVNVANLDHAPARDNKGPRKGKGATGKVDGK
jgi:peptidase M28-like protein